MKKSPEEIKQEILETLEQGPLSIQQISKGIESNWLTVDKFIKELIEEIKIREIILPNKTKVYRLIREDTYLDIPVTKEEKEIFYFLFDNSRKQFIEQGKRTPTKTDIQKSVVKVIDHFNLQAPAVWYLFGRMTLMKYEQDENYSTKFIPENSTEILNFLRGVVKELIKQGSAKRVREEQYESYSKKLYQIKEELYEFILNKDLDENKQEFKRTLIEFFVRCSSKEDSIEINKVIHNFILLIGKLSILEKLNENKKSILETFDVIWKMVALYIFFDSLVEYPRFSRNRNEIRALYFEDSLSNRISTAKDFLSNLYSVYIEQLNEIKEPPVLPDIPEARIVRDLFLEMANEGVKENESVS